MSLVERALAKMRTAVQIEPTKPEPLKNTTPIAHLEEQSSLVGTELSGVTEREVVLRQRRSSGRLATVDQSALRAAGLLAPEDQERRTADEYRHIKRPLLDSIVKGDKNRNLIMIGSAFSGDGKSFTCVNLSMSLSVEKDWSVLLVDADVIKPQISRLFGLETESGLVDVLRSPDLDPDTLIVDTNIPGLSILPAGSQDEYATELLSSARMRKVVEQLGSQYSNRIVVFDSPPLLQTSEAKVLADFMGQVVVVVGANRTPQSAVIEATKLIGDPKRTRLLLNRAGRGNGGYYYGYGYGYGYHDAVESQE